MNRRVVEIRCCLPVKNRIHCIKLHWADFLIKLCARFASQQQCRFTVNQTQIELLFSHCDILTAVKVYHRVPAACKLFQLTIATRSSEGLYPLLYSVKEVVAVNVCNLLQFTYATRCCKDLSPAFKHNLAFLRSATTAPWPRGRIIRQRNIISGPVVFSFILKNKDRTE